MARTKLVVVTDENSRANMLKKKWVGLVRMISQLTILCDVKACLIMVSHKKAEQMVWPSFEVAQGLSYKLFALPEFEKKKKETTLESYLKEKTKKVCNQLKRIQKKNKEYKIGQLMMQVDGDHTPADRNLNEIYELISFSKDKIMHLRKMLGFMHHSPLAEAPVNPFEVQSEDNRKTTNDMFMIGDGQDDEITTIADERAQKINNIGTLRENHGHYLMDQWIFPSSILSNHQIHEQVVMGMTSYNQNSNPRYFLPYQGSSSKGNSNLEMQQVGPPMKTFHGMVGSVSQPLQHHHTMSDNPLLAMNQPRKYFFDFMSCEKRSNISIGDLQIQMSNNTMTTDDGLRQEPPMDETTIEEGKADATTFDIN
ncbi:unnamed protein product [Thlaspi arvense]|uniref:MADS-box domain-containing protein n=1 Tax=Thlaspi arvense TaxID=13288 RepID=A0AAU9RBV6_THLAR|nr:unnamed protein product [Thlaspi arvense]